MPPNLTERFGQRAEPSYKSTHFHLILPRLANGRPPRTHSPRYSPMASSSSARTAVDMQLAEYTFARWVYIDKCHDFVDQYGTSVPNISAIVDTLGSETACIRALILHGHMAKGRQTRYSYTKGVRGLTPVEAFKEALRIGLAAAKVSPAPKADIPTRPWERTSHSIHWLAPRFVVPHAGRPVFIPRPLTGPSSLWCTANPSSSTTASGTDLISAPPPLCTVQTQPAGNMQGDLSASWSCGDADILYRNGECTVYPRLPNMKAFVVTGLPPVHLHVLHHSKPDPKAGNFHTSARSVSPNDVKDTPLLLLWSCVHGDLFVQAPQQVLAPPPVGSFNLANPSFPSAAFNLPPGMMSLQQYAYAYQSRYHPPPLPASHVFPAPPPQFLPMFHASQQYPHQYQQPAFPASAPPGMLPLVPQLPMQRADVRGPTNAQIQSLTVSSQQYARGLLLPQSAPQPPPQSLSVFQPRAPPTSASVSPSAAPKVSVSKKKKRVRRRSVPAPGPSRSANSANPKAPVPLASSASCTAPSTFPRPSSVSAPVSTASAPVSTASAPISSSSAPALPPSVLAPTSAVTPSTSTPADPAPPTKRRGPEKTPCGLDDCAVTLTPSTWEEHYASAHNISEETWVPDSLCAHPACREAHAAAEAAISARTQPKLTIAVWATYKRHVKQMHFPKGRTHFCTIPGCTAVLSRADALLRHVETKHKVAHEGRERTPKRAWAGDDSEAGSPKKKKARTASSPIIAQAQPAIGAPMNSSAALDMGSVAFTWSLSRKGKEVARAKDPKKTRSPSSASAPSGVRPSMFRTSRDDEDMLARDEDERMARSGDFEYDDDQWTGGDDMDCDPDNYD